MHALHLHRLAVQNGHICQRQIYCPLDAVSQLLVGPVHCDFSPKGIHQDFSGGCAVHSSCPALCTCAFTE